MVNARPPPTNDSGQVSGALLKVEFSFVGDTFAKALPSFSPLLLHERSSLEPETRSSYFSKNIYVYIYIYISRKAKQIPESTILVGRDLSRRSGRSLPTASQPKTSLGAGSRVQCSPMFRVQQSECGLAGLESSSKKRFL